MVESINYRIADRSNYLSATHNHAHYDSIFDIIICQCLGNYNSTNIIALYVHSGSHLPQLG